MMWERWTASAGDAIKRDEQCSRIGYFQIPPSEYTGISTLKGAFSFKTTVEDICGF